MILSCWSGQDDFHSFRRFSLLEGSDVPASHRLLSWRIPSFALHYQCLLGDSVECTIKNGTADSIADLPILLYLLMFNDVLCLLHESFDIVLLEVPALRNKWCRQVATPSADGLVDGSSQLAPETLELGSWNSLLHSAVVSLSKAGCTVEQVMKKTGELSKRVEKVHMFFIIFRFPFGINGKKDETGMKKDKKTQGAWESCLSGWESCVLAAPCGRWIAAAPFLLATAAERTGEVWPEMPGYVGTFNILVQCIIPVLYMQYIYSIYII